MNFQVLLAEDEPLQQALVKAVVAKLGPYETIVAGDGRACLSLIDGGLVPDVMLLDLAMPQSGGFDVLESLSERELLGKIPVLVLTADRRPDIVLRAARLGAVDYVVKPLDAATLTARVVEHVNPLSEVTLQTVLANCRMPDPTLFRQAGLRGLSPRTHDAYQVQDQGRSTCVVVPAGQGPAALARQPLATLVRHVQLFRKPGLAWRAAWPTPALKRRFGLG